MSNNESNVVLATKQWLDEIIIGLNFCPFAKKEFVNNTINYHLSSKEQAKSALAELIEQCLYLQQHDELETTLVIYQDGYNMLNCFLSACMPAALSQDSGFTTCVFIPNVDRYAGTSAAP